MTIICDENDESRAYLKIGENSKKIVKTATPLSPSHQPLRNKERRSDPLHLNSTQSRSRKTLFLNLGEIASSSRLVRREIRQVEWSCESLRCILEGALDSVVLYRDATLSYTLPVRV